MSSPTSLCFAFKTNPSCFPSASGQRQNALASRQEVRVFVALDAPVVHRGTPSNALGYTIPTREYA